MKCASGEYVGFFHYFQEHGIQRLLTWCTPVCPDPVWDLRAGYRITLGQKSLAALFQRLWPMGLMEDVFSSASSSETTEQSQALSKGEGEAMSLPSCPKLAPRAPEGLGTPAVGMARWLQGCCLPRAWIWDVAGAYAPGLCCLALSTVRPCPQSHLPHSAWCPPESAVG